MKLWHEAQFRRNSSLPRPMLSPRSDFCAMTGSPASSFLMVPSSLRS